MKMIKDPHLKKIVKFANSVKMVPNDEFLDGTVEIKKIRKYPGRFYDYFCEVDIVYKGKFFGFHGGKVDWYDSDILSSNDTSKIRLNRYFRGMLNIIVRERLKVFMGSQLEISIKNVKWE